MNLTNHGRQTVLTLEQAFDYTDLAAANLASGVSKLKPTLPQGAIVVGGGVLVETVFDGTAPTADFGNAGTPNLYLNDLNLKVAAYTAFTGGVGSKKATGETVLVTPSADAQAATVGKGTLIIQYIVAGRAGEVQPS